MVAVHAYAGGKVGFGYTYAAAAAGRPDRGSAGPGGPGFRRPGRAGGLGGDEPRRPQHRPARRSLHGDFGRGRRLVGPESAGCSACRWSRSWARARDAVPVYGSGGFTSYTPTRLQEQLAGWVAQGIPRVKMKIGTHPADDFDRVRAARNAIGDKTELFVDANGAYSRKQALAFAERFAELGVTWFEEPVSSDDLEGLRLIRDRAPAGMEIAAGEYGFDHFYFRRMLDAGAVDVLQADATRCGGDHRLFERRRPVRRSRDAVVGPLRPALHAHPCCAALPVRHVEYFHDHARIEQMLFDGALTPIDGALRPDRSRPRQRPGAEARRRRTLRRMGRLTHSPVGEETPC